MDAKVTITPVIPPGPSLVVDLYDGPAVITSPGGWQNIARPRRTAITEWQGQDPVTMDVPIILDGFFENASIEAQISILFGWLRIANGPGQTPTLRLDGPIPSVAALWVLNGIEWGIEERRDSDGQRTRQAMILKMLEYVPGDPMVQARPSPAVAAIIRAAGSAAAASVATSSAATVGVGTTTVPAPGQPSTTTSPATAVTPAAHPAAGMISTSTYTVRSGDTLATISQRLLGSTSKWSLIADMNDIRDPRKIHVGQVLKIPYIPGPSQPLEGVVLGGHGRLS